MYILSIIAVFVFTVLCLGGRISVSFSPVVF